MKYLLFASLLAVGAFASKCHPNYECCNSCDAVFSDNEGNWGVENNQWCFINESLCSAISGYPTCKNCKVYFTDSTGDWGVENNQWCFINKSQCNSTPVFTGKPELGQDVVIPVLHLISESGTSNFATEPVSKHIAQQSANNRGAPEPYYEACDITLETPDGKTPLDGVKGKVKVRGNWTTNYPKKPLRINFDESTNLLGLHGGEKYKSWVLLAEYKDGSMLRNKAAFAMSRPFLSVDNLFASDAALVELRINNEYFGVYVLAENQQIASKRVDITKAEEGYEGTDIGYLLELDLGYAYAEEELQKITVDFNNNAPLTPFDGQGGSGKSITPLQSGFGGGMGGFDMSMFGGAGGAGGAGGFGGFGGFGGRTQAGAANPQAGAANPQAGAVNPQAGAVNPQAGAVNPQTGGNINMGGMNFGGANTGGMNFGGANTGGMNFGGATAGGMNFGGAATGANVNLGNASPVVVRKRQFAAMGGSGENMTIKSDVYSAQQRDFIESYINNVYKILYEAAYNNNPLKFNSDYTNVVSADGWSSQKVIENVIDANSLADMYIISEMTCDADLYYSSFYMDVDFGPNGSKKLRFECPWDFDSGLGNKERCSNGTGYFAANAIPDNGGFMGNKINPWLAVIIYEDWFQDIIRSKWTKAYDSGVFSDVVEMIKTDTTVSKNAIDRNYQKWDNINKNNSFRNELSQNALKCKSQQQHASYLAAWIKARADFVNTIWHN